MAGIETASANRDLIGNLRHELTDNADAERRDLSTTVKTVLRMSRGENIPEREQLIRCLAPGMLLTRSDMIVSYTASPQKVH